jgi:ElaB/YqjD/DUF883 family membrane-anchored ribosome-binding protein
MCRSIQKRFTFTEEIAMNANAELQREAVMDNLKAVITSAEELLRMSEGNGEEKTLEVRTRIQERMRQAKADLLRMQESALARVKAAGHATDEFVHENPWKSAGIAAGAGLLVGLLLARR